MYWDKSLSSNFTQLHKGKVKVSKTGPVLELHNEKRHWAVSTVWYPQGCQHPPLMQLSVEGNGDTILFPPNTHSHTQSLYPHQPSNYSLPMLGQDAQILSCWLASLCHRTQTSLCQDNISSVRKNGGLCQSRLTTGSSLTEIVEWFRYRELYLLIWWTDCKGRNETVRKTL